VTIRLYDTGTRGVRDFVPITPGQATIYLCGATVQGEPHIGHVRGSVDYDILARWLGYRGYQVTLCRNVTDIDDKILAKAAVEGEPWWALAARNERAFSWAYDVLGCLPPRIEPRATGHVPQMIELMRELIDAGHAYASGGDVYFDVRSFREYGALSNQRLENLRAAEDGEGSGKRDPRDFTLWKAARPGEPSWSTPWGPGRPGWHLECSAMARAYLGAEFDIHGGGLDLVFPHHENEQAQSRAAGDAFTRYWVHYAWVTLSGEKMSKSLGNTLAVSEMVKRFRPVVLRYYLAAPHYRSMIEYSDEAIAEAATAYERVENFVRRAVELVGVVPPATEAPAEFAAAMDEDLGVPQALAVLHNEVRDGNTALAAGDKEAAAVRLAQVRLMLGVLGLDPLEPPWNVDRADEGLRDVVDSLVRVALEARQDARARKDFGAADAIRDQLAVAGIVIEDTPAGPRWTLRDR
jgi:cysteinyl-tRNA synthetase